MNVREIIIADRNEEAMEILLTKMIADTLAKFEGKMVTKRFATAIEKDLKAACGERVLVSYDKPEYGSTTIYVWGEDVNRKWDNRLLLFFRSGTVNRLNDLQLSLDGFDLEDFKDHNICHYAAAEERQTEREKKLADDYCEELQERIDRYCEEGDSIYMRLNGTPSEYKIRHEFGLDHLTS